MDKKKSNKIHRNFESFVFVLVVDVVVVVIYFFVKRQNFKTELFV